MEASANGPIAVVGAGGAIGGHLTRRLVDEGHDVLATDLRPLDDWWQVIPGATSYGGVDASTAWGARDAVGGARWVFDMAENMGGIAWITSERVECAESIEIGIHLLRASVTESVDRFWFCSSACVYNTDLQRDPANPGLREEDAWPAKAEDGYGEAKLYMEQLCRYYAAERDLTTRIGRYHNVMGPHGAWRGGKEKSPAALARKVAEAPDGGTIEVWGDGEQTRSYLYADDCVEATLRLMASDYPHPLNIGSDQLISVNDLARLLIDISGKHLSIVHVDGPQGVRGRCSDNTMCRSVLGWEPRVALGDGLESLYAWVAAEVDKAARHA